MKFVSCADLRRISPSLPVREVWIEIGLPRYLYIVVLSLPVREVWIEISTHAEIAVSCVSSLPVREVWIEIKLIPYSFGIYTSSLPVREVWIEIGKSNLGIYTGFFVTSREGSVD